MRATIPYLQLGFERLTTATRRVTDEEVIVAPFGAGTTSIAGLVTHCAGVSEFWLGHVGLGRPSERDRDGEFTATGTVDELIALAEAAAAQAAADIEALLAGGGQPNEMRAFALDGGTDEALVLHVIEEVFQHVGHVEITADILEHRRA